MKRDFFTFAMTSLIAFVVYWATTAPGLGLVDAGELTTAAATLSIAHPTGYPLYTTLGHVWLILWPLSVARGMVVFSSLACALGSGVLALVALRLLAASTHLSENVRVIVAVLLSVGIALSRSAWTSVDFAEVYPLTWLIASLLLLLAVISERKDEVLYSVAPLIMCYLWGLGFGNHLTIMWFAPLTFFVAIRYVMRSEKRTLAILLCGGLYLLGTSINLYLPIRSARGPLLDWSAPHTLAGLIRQLTAWQYRVWMFKGDWTVLLHKFRAFVGDVPGDVGWAVALLALIGLIVALARKSWLIVSIAAVWLVGTLYNINYDIADISTYFLVFYAPLFVIGVFGLVWLIEQAQAISKNRLTAALVAVVLALSVPISSVLMAGTSGVESSNRFAETYTKEILNTLPPHALVIQANWDIESPFIYLHNIEHARPDVVMLDLNLMQRSWYIQQEQRNDPTVFAGVEPQIAVFLREVAPFESGKPYDGRRIESAFVALLDSIISRQSQVRPVYIRDTYQSGHGEIARSMKMIPGGYFMRVTTASVPEPVIDADGVIAAVAEHDDRVDYLLKQAALAASYQGDYAMHSSDTLTLRRAMNASARLAGNDPQIAKFVGQSLQYLANTQKQNGQ
jgi:hypothetical protein